MYSPLVFSFASNKVALRLSKASGVQGLNLMKTAMFSSNIDYASKHLLRVQTNENSDFNDIPLSAPNSSSLASEWRPIRSGVREDFFLAINGKVALGVQVKRAVVLVPICLIDGRPSVLFTVRSKHQRAYPGDVCFPGGKKDLSDVTLMETALRETFEEIGIPPSDVQVIGQLEEIPFNKGAIEVTPIIGLVEKNLIWSSGPHNARQSSKNSLALKINSDKVEECFTIPLSELHSGIGIKLSCSSEPLPLSFPSYTTPDYIPNDICGLTVHILMDTLRRLPHSLPLSSKLNLLMLFKNINKN